jgi:hypothetical protein
MNISPETFIFCYIVFILMAGIVISRLLAWFRTGE